MLSGGGQETLTQNSDVVLNFPYKDCLLEGGISKAESARQEIFFNEVLARDEITQLLQPKVLTNGSIYQAKKQQPFHAFNRRHDGTISDNLLIKGNNLLALHSLKESFTNKVKVIYIDPPYNTGRDDFKYNDRFTHSTWLTFMKNRLEIARQLLRDDGLIIISIDDNEQAYLKVLCDEVFGANHFIALTPRKTRTSRSDVPYGLSQNFDWLLMYTKNDDSNQKLFKRKNKRKWYQNEKGDNAWRLQDLTTQATIEDVPDSNFTIVNPKTGQEFPVNPNRAWSISKNTYPKHLKAGKIVFPGDYDFLTIKQPKFRIFKWEDIRKKGQDFDTIPVNNNDFISNEYLTAVGTKEIQRHFQRKVFAFPKPVNLIRQLLEYTTSKDDIILDFFAGSGTTGEAVLRLNAEDNQKRQFILIEQLKEHIDICQKRLRRVIEEERQGTAFTYFELKKYNQIFIEQIKLARTQTDILKVWEQMKTKSFLNYNVDLKKQDKRMQNLQNKSLSEQKRELIECLDSNQLYVNQSSVDDQEFTCSKAEKALTKAFYSQ